MTSILFCKETNCNPNILMIQCVFYCSFHDLAKLRLRFRLRFRQRTARLSFRLTLTLAPAGVDLRFIVQPAAPLPVFVIVIVVATQLFISYTPLSISNIIVSIGWDFISLLLNLLKFSIIALSIIPNHTRENNYNNLIYIVCKNSRKVI